MLSARNFLLHTIRKGSLCLPPGTFRSVGLNIPPNTRAQQLHRFKTGSVLKRFKRSGDRDNLEPPETENLSDNDEGISKKKAPRTAMSVIAASLARRPHSNKELQDNLERLGFDKDTIKSDLGRLAELGLQSDREFAEIFARSKWRQSRWAPSRIRMDLKMRGVSHEDIEAALREVFGDEDKDLFSMLEPEVTDELSMEPSAGMDAELLQAARNHVHHSRGLPVETRRRRVVSWLQRRGHKWNTIVKILEQLDL